MYSLTEQEDQTTHVGRLIVERYWQTNILDRSGHDADR